MPHVRQNPRTLDDPLSHVEQGLQPQDDPALVRRDPDSAADLGTDGNVLSDLDRRALNRNRHVQCTVAGRFFRYSYYWADNPAVRDPHCSRRLTFLCIDGYRNGYGRCEGLPDDIQPPAMVGLSASLEMAAPRSMGPERTLPDLFFECKESPSGYTRKYSGVGPRSTIIVYCMVGHNTSQQRMHHDSLPTAVMHRCDLTSDMGRQYFDLRDITVEWCNKLHREKFEHFLPTDQHLSPELMADMYRKTYKQLEEEFLETFGDGPDGPDIEHLPY